jgi:hypothetical protein
MARLDKDLEVAASPDQVIAALTDFSERRPDVWRSLAREFYEVYSVGETEAEVREGSKPPSVWAKEHYDWSTPGTVKWTVRESNFCKPGSYVQATVLPGDVGGSRIHVTWERWPSNLKGRVLTALIVAIRGAPIWSSVKKNLDRLAKPSA